MPDAKDRFSGHASQYAVFRPTYPQALYDFIFQQVSAKATAWDCATGNGQVAADLAKVFKKVYATDISLKQIENARQRSNIEYSVAPANASGLPDATCDLITVGQAIHWFDIPGFYSEVRRVAKPGAWLAVWGYGLLKIGETEDQIIQHYYKEIVGPYWDPERKLIDEGYQTIPFPFPETQAPNFSSDYMWTLDQFLGYARTWSAYMHYLKANEKDPLPELEKELLSCWKPGETKKISFPILFRVGRNDK